MNNSTTCYPLRKALSVASTNNGFAAKIPTTTKPAASSTRAVVNLYDATYGIATDTFVPQYIQLVPYGTNANDETHNLRLWGWSKTTDTTPVWVPQLILDLSVTLGNIDASALESSAFMADTITVNVGGDEATKISSAGDTPASILTHLRGCELFEIEFDIGTGDAGNCLWRVMDER